jgi:DNA-binding transcriptional LysR family regulator
MDKLDSMRLFVLVAKTGGFARAGAHASTSTSVVSRAIMELESRLQARLVNRTTRRISLTEAGRQYLQHCTEILAQIDLAEAEAADSSVHPAGRLRVHASTSFGQHVLTPLLSLYSERFSSVAVDLVLDQRLPNIVDEDFDVAIAVISQLSDSSLVSQRLGSIRPILCASTDYLASFGIPKSVSDLGAHQCLHLASPETSSTLWVFEDPGLGSFEPPGLPKFTVNLPEAMAEAIRAGMGIGMLPIPTALQGLRDGTLTQVLPELQLRPYGIYAIYASRHFLDAKIRTLLDFLRETLPGNLERQERELMSVTRPHRETPRLLPSRVVYS